ncbi:protein HIRA [Neocloeon triangulifer]|uniref:protein HIRA n=1 Tax=Neocloeon triangulifer TaxID=2078957 RepID=UPI00286F3B09|nr:protein HIRA [Neocloeon triangulifer]
MKLLKPAWVAHEGRPIFSIDIHPDGSRFATGGQGEDCGRVVIWNMAPVLSEEVEKDENVPKLLCQMDNHLACVNCVRWNMSGRYLASCGDDKTILIWQHSGSGGSVFGGGSTAESWRCVFTLRSHSGDVLDLAWAPHDAWLASSSVDNSIIIWNALNFPEVITVLRGHSGLVKGVVWDPIGKFLASQSDDKSLRVWRTSDWKQETSITEPFKECGGTTHVLRMSWSPDGQYLVSAHAMNGGGPTAQIIEREGWVTDKDFVGHRKAITCVRFNGNILLKSLPHSNKPQQYCCCAIGSRDRSISVWSTALKRPVVTIKELFNDSVLDLSWSASGCVLMVCSWDGTVACVEFEEKEIGKALSASEKKALHERIYGKSLSVPNSLTSTTIVETPELLAVRESQRQQQNSTPTKVNSVSKPNTNIPSPMRGPSKQIETRTSDGKRRITPMFIPTVVDNGEAPQPFSSSSQPTFSSSTETTSKIVIEKREDIITPNVSKPSNQKPQSQEKLESASPSKSMDVDQTPPKPPPPKLIETPEKVNGSASDSMDQPTPLTSKVDKPSESKPEEAPKVEDKPKEDKPKSEEKIEKTPSVSFQDKPTEIKTKTGKRRGRPPLSEKVDRLEKTEKTIATPAAPAPVQTPAAQSPAKQVLVVAENEFKLPALGIDKTLNVKVSGCLGKVLTVENSAVASSFGPLNLVKCYFSNKSPNDKGSDWEAVLSSKAVAAGCNAFLCAVCCEDCTLIVFETMHGRRPLPPLQLSGRPSRLIVSRGHIFVLTVKGMLSVWDVPAKKAVLVDKSITHLLDKNASVVSCQVMENGNPVLTLSTGKLYLYCNQLKAWTLLGDGRDPVQQSSSHLLYANAVTQSGNLSASPMPPLTALQSASKVHFRSNLSSASGPATSCTLTFLEQQMASSRLLQSSRDYHLWLSAFVRFLVHEGMEARLRLIFDELLGPAHPHSANSRSWDDKIMGLSKHQLLQEMLTVVASNLSLQRLYSEYNDLLESATSSK